MQARDETGHTMACIDTTAIIPPIAFLMKRKTLQQNMENTHACSTHLIDEIVHGQCLFFNCVPGVVPVIK